MIAFLCEECNKTYDMSEIALEDIGATPRAFRCPVNRKHRLFISITPAPLDPYDSIPSIPAKHTTLDLTPFLERAADNPYFSTEECGEMVTYCYWCSRYIGDQRGSHDPNCLHLKAKVLLRALRQ